MISHFSRGFSDPPPPPPPDITHLTINKKLYVIKLDYFETVKCIDKSKMQRHIWHRNSSDNLLRDNSQNSDKIQELQKKLFI